MANNKAMTMNYEEGRKLTEVRSAMRTKSRNEFEAIFSLARFKVFHVFELANGYWPDAPNYDNVREPWWLMLTEIGPIQVGWRKRVIHIEWKACDFRGIVTDDEVTKGPYYVHASATEKAVEYLKTLHKQAMSEKQTLTNE